MSSMAALLLTLGILFLVLSWVQLLIVSSKEDFSWALCTVFLPPLAYFYGLFVWAKAKDAILMAVLAWLMLFLSTVS